MMAGTGANEHRHRHFPIQLEHEENRNPPDTAPPENVEENLRDGGDAILCRTTEKAAAGPENAFRCKIRSRRGVLLSSDGLVEVQENAREGEPFILGIIADNLLQAGALGV